MVPRFPTHTNTHTNTHIHIHTHYIHRHHFNALADSPPLFRPPPFPNTLYPPPLSTLVEFARPFELKLVGDREHLPRGVLIAGRRQVTPLCLQLNIYPLLSTFFSCPGGMYCRRYCFTLLFNIDR